MLNIAFIIFKLLKLFYNKFEKNENNLLVKIKINCIPNIII